MTQTPLYQPRSVPMRLAIFMSGSGTNAKKIMEEYLSQRDNGNLSFQPVLMFTDNPDSRAVRIATVDYKERGLVIPVTVNPIAQFYNAQGCRDIKDLVVRRSYDSMQQGMLASYGVDAVALAGYDWRVTAEIHEHFLTVNVHPGDLRVKNESGEPKYIGLAWVPSAKAILAGERFVYTTVHLVDDKLDTGAILAVSDPQPVPQEVACLEHKASLLGSANSLKEILQYIRNNRHANEEELSRRFPIYGHARACQELLKINGDWKVFPKAIDDIARGNYAKDGSAIKR